jgi:hypothetical protein
LTAASLTFAALHCYAEDLAALAHVEATSMATEATGTYGVERLRDGQAGTHWASAADAELPQRIRFTWNDPVSFDTVVVDVFWKSQSNIYAPIKTIRLVLDGDPAVTRTLTRDDPEFVILRLEEPRSVSEAVIEIAEVHAPATYVGITEISFHTDPGKRIAPPRDIARPRKQTDLMPRGRAAHPCVYINAEDVARARKHAETTPWGKAERDRILREAERWLEHDPTYWTQFLPEPGACYAYGFTGCPICGARFGTWGGARCSWDQPGKATCANGHSLPNEEYPDSGAGYRAPDGRYHYIVGTWNAWVTEQWTRTAIPALADAYALTGNDAYAERAALFLDLIASIYAESTSGSWDYPSRPPSGRLARPWYQVARNLVVYVEAYDLIYSSTVLDHPSLRPALETRFKQPSTLQKTEVGTPDAHGWSKPGMTRRQNIDRNLVMNGGTYCYEHSFKGDLTNGHADYLRGALAAGALLGVDEFVSNAVDSPYSIYTMLANNADRDGRYYETALGYALHARNLYLTFVGPLRNWRSEALPNGINLFDDSRMRSFYYLPDSVMDCAGHSPNFGDVGPDNRFRIAGDRPDSSTDAWYAENLLAGTQGSVRDTFAGITAYLADGDLPGQRQAASYKRWLLYHAASMPETTRPEIPDDLQMRLYKSWLLGQKGIGILRDGNGANAQAALLRYGPSLNHGDKDDLGLLYYAKGWQMTYDIGYGLGSTHCQVGWASQTASHSLVTVDETSQGGASGGSAYLFADLPGIKIMEADSPLSYSNRGVTVYRRTVALLGDGRDQVLVDLFRVKGGSTHDYIVGVQSRAWTIDGLDLGPEEDGSLAPGVAWGERVGLDGDITGVPNKPYWNPPPGTGYGFFFDMRRAPAEKPFVLTFDLGGPNRAHLRLHPLPDADTEAIIAKAPGLYPHNSDATYMLLRRQTTTANRPAASAFACVMEPFATPLPERGLDVRELNEQLSEANAETKMLNGLDVLLLKGTRPGDFMEFTIPVEKAGRYRLAAGVLCAPSYGTVGVSVDGAPVGTPFDACRAQIEGPVHVVFGDLNLTAGLHRVRFTMKPDERFFVSLGTLSLEPADQAETVPANPTPVIVESRRLPVSSGSSEVIPLCIEIRRVDRTEYLLSGDRDADELTTAKTSFGDIAWRGGIVHATFADGSLTTLTTHGAWDVRIGGQSRGPRRGSATARVRALNGGDRWVDLDTTITPDDLGPCVYFRNPGYSRDTAYRIKRIESRPDGVTRLHLGDQSFLLGKGRVLQRHDKTVIASDIPHDYARSVVGGANTRFFDGKRITNDRGDETTIREMRYQKPLKITVDDNSAFNDGDTLFYYDVSPGDTAIIPTVWTAGAPETERPRP